MNANALGVKIIRSGRLGGAEIARSERQMLGSIPAQTLQAHVDYGFAVSVTTYGTIGVKVWVYLGPYGQETEAPAGGARPMVRMRRGQKRG